ncbi:2-aminoethanethiol dioxygenase [Macrobrachium rosenbergii]|uniref:2-aminoethanethiol dioxygenase n=1 Tax=Macrobrachium rosenbergii TaxID=79674 RepID=UPI0034D72E61
MTSLIQQIGRLAIRTFKRDSQVPEAVFNSRYEQLYNLVNRVTPEDINLDHRLLSDRGQFNASTDGAPVTYMQVYEDNDVTICVFILKRGVRLPLHDHPGMFGMLKVIHGSVSVQSYSHTNTESLEEKLQEILNTRPSAGVCPATKHQKVLVTASDKACRLTPNSQNIHEIHSIDGPAAFLDILSPPYGTDKRLGVERDCHYYQEVESFNVPYLSIGSLTFLVSIPSPTDFWCDQAEYTGPIIDRNAIEENGS